MRAAFFRADAPDEVVGEAEWDGRRAVISAEDEDVRTALEAVFRPAPVAVNETVVAPGDLAWFRAAARVRGSEAGFSVRFVSEVAERWDPALDPQTYGWGGRKPALPPS